MRFHLPNRRSIAAHIFAMTAALAIATPSGAGLTRTTDHATAAFLAQRDGNYAECAKHADKARKTRGANYTLHRLFAACTVNAADAERHNLTASDYADRLAKAVDALNVLRSTPGAYHQPKANNVISLTIQDLETRIKAARSTAPTN